MSTSLIYDLITRHQGIGDNLSTNEMKIIPTDFKKKSLTSPKISAIIYGVDLKVIKEIKSICSLKFEEMIYV